MIIPTTNMQTLRQFPISRSINRQYFTPTSKALESPEISKEVVDVINAVHPIEPALNNFAPNLNREDVVSVLRSQAQLNTDPRICFRLFIWAAEIARFRSGVSHNLIVDMLLSGPDSFDLYWSVLDELRNQKRPIPADAFGVLILGYWRSKKADKAVETFERMKDYGCKPNLAAYNVILNVFVKKGAIRLAMAVYGSMLKLNFNIGCDTFSVLLDGLYKDGMTRDAEKLRGAIISPNVIIYTVIISGLCKSKRTDDAEKLFNLMKSSGYKLESSTYNALLDGFCKYRDVDTAFMLFQSFKNDDIIISIQAYSSLIRALIRAKRYSKADELFNEVIEVGLVPDIILFTIRMRGLCEAGRIDDATNMLRHMIDQGVEPDSQFYNVAIKGLCDIGLSPSLVTTKLLDIFRVRSLTLGNSQSDQFPNTYTYTILICSLCRNGRLGEALQIFSDMAKHGCIPSVVTFNAIIDGLCKADKLQEAAKVMFLRMGCVKRPVMCIRLSQGPDRVSDIPSLERKLKNMVESGDIKKAYRFMMQILDSGALPDTVTYNTLINGIFRNGDVDGVLDVHKKLLTEGLSPDSVTYATLINGLHSVGRDEEAQKTFREMIDKGYELTPSVYKTRMTWLCRRGKISYAFNLWLEYLRSLGSRDNETLKLIEVYFGKGKSEKALRILLEMETKLTDFDPAPCNIFLVGWCQINKVEEALKIFSILEEYNVIVSAASCVKLINALVSERKLSQTVGVFLYTMEKRYVLQNRVFNNLLRYLLKSDNTSGRVAFRFLGRMIRIGYDLDSDFHHSTKLLLHRRQNSVMKMGMC